MADARLFVSHSHHDNTFGLRLIADLRARLGGEDAVWFDASGGLQGGDEWWHTIVNEILTRNYFLVILSPEALASPWVRKEMDLAYNQHVSRGKRLLPLLYHPCELAADWQLIQSIAIVDPQQDATAYESGLQNVLKWIDPALGVGITPARSMYSDEYVYNLYKQGLEARNRQQWEACADAWRKVLAADPKYLGGSLATDMQEVEREVAALNIQRLRQAVQQAKAGGQSSEIVQALYGLTLADPADNAAKQDLWAAGVAKADAEHHRGAWVDEIATWELLLRVLPSYNYATRRKTIAEQNQQYVQMYRLACDLAQEGQKAEAAEQLTRLWQRDRAPYYGDPAGIAPALGMQLLPTYDTVSAEKARKKVELSKMLDDVNSDLMGLNYRPWHYPEVSGGMDCLGLALANGCVALILGSVVAFVVGIVSAFWLVNDENGVLAMAIFIGFPLVTILYTISRSAYDARKKSRYETLTLKKAEIDRQLKSIQD